MAYDRSEGRGGWREPRSNTGRDHGENRSPSRNWDRDDDRGFFERAGDEVASWFGDDDAERRRREDMSNRGDEDSWRRPRTFIGDEDAGRYDRQAKYRDEGYRRPYTGRFSGRRPGDDEERFDRGNPAERGWTERWERGRSRDQGNIVAGGLHDPHYAEWRRRELDSLDRDYDEYRRENQSRFESDFSNWRTTRQGKRQTLGQVREHMSVVGSDDEAVGTVDCVRRDRIVLTKGDSEDGRHHSLSCSMVDRVEGDRVILDQPAAEAKRRFEDEQGSRGFFRDDDDRGPHILNRSFSGTY